MPSESYSLEDLRAIDKDQEDMTTAYKVIAKFDGVVESPIYCVAAVFQTLGILHVLPRP